MIDNASGNELTPSVVHFTEDDTAIIGKQAEEKALMAPDRTVAEIKRQIGEDVTVQVGDDEYRPEEISALILEKVVTDAEERIGTAIERGVVTVPAYFTGRQRTATRNAAKIAGLEAERLLPEPSAAVLAYGRKQKKLGNTANETIFVFDFGGGTFDVTLVKAEYEHNYVETILTDGNSSLGGADWTAAIAEWVVNGIETDTGVNITETQEFADQRNRIRSAAREAKHELSHKRETVVNIPFVLPEQGYSFEGRLTREMFAEMTEPLLAKTRSTIDSLFSEADIGRNEVETILLVGGASRMVQVEQMLESYFGQSPSKQINPDEAVAMGAAVQASILSPDNSQPRGSISGTGDDSQQAAGVTKTQGQADDDDDDFVLIDVLPQALGVELYDGSFSRIIENGTTLPATVRKEQYGTIEPDQTDVRWPIYQGESDIAENNDLLGTIWIRNIPPREPFENTIAIEFIINEDGTLEVEVEDLITNKMVEDTIESGIRFSTEEINRMSARSPPIE